MRIGATFGFVIAKDIKPAALARYITIKLSVKNIPRKVGTYQYDYDRRLNKKIFTYFSRRKISLHNISLSCIYFIVKTQIAASIIFSLRLFLRYFVVFSACPRAIIPLFVQPNGNE